MPFPNSSDPLSKTNHRPWPLPQPPWLMLQIWRDLLFTHYSLSPDALRPLIPPQLQLDLFQERAWLSITPFHMSLRFRGLPRFSGMGRLPELNCRTYVTFQNKPGVYFFSLDIVSRLAVFGARALYHLPYFHARMSIEQQGDSISYSSQRRQARWRGEYSPISPSRLATPGSLDYFLSERYCLYSVRNNRIYRGDIHHIPWPLQDASVTIAENTVAEAAGISVPRTANRCAFARELKVLIWPPIRVL